MSIHTPTPSVAEAYVHRDKQITPGEPLAFAGARFKWYDVAVREHDGYYRLLGRESVDILKTGGYKVSALEIEETLRDHPAIAEASVVGVPDDEWGERVKAVVAVSSGVSPSDELAQALVVFCKERLASLKCPRSIDFVELLPRDSLGKISRRRLREPFWAGRERKI